VLSCVGSIHNLKDLQVGLRAVPGFSLQLVQYKRSKITSRHPEIHNSGEIFGNSQTPSHNFSLASSVFACRGVPLTTQEASCGKMAFGAGRIRANATSPARHHLSTTHLRWLGGVRPQWGEPVRRVCSRRPTPAMLWCARLIKNLMKCVSI
jgi:hypothetical protein